MDTTVRKVNGNLAGQFTDNGGKVIELSLGDKQIYTLEGDHRGAKIISLKGSLWVTQPADPNDYVLQAGEELTVDRAGSVVLQALPEGRARIITRSTLN